MSREKVSKLLKRLNRLGFRDPTNKVIVYHDGAKAFPEMWSAINRSQDRVYFESYIWELDPVGTKFADSLIQAKKSGCEVMVLYDQVGSLGFHFSDKRQEMEAHGIQIQTYHQLYNKFRKFSQWRSPLHRNHRKLLICDDVAFTGGLNATQDYASPPVGNGRFRDTHLQLQGGTAIDNLVHIFHSSFKYADVRIIEGENPKEKIQQKIQMFYKRRKDRKEKIMSIDEKLETQTVQILKSNPYTRRSIYNAIIRAIVSAEKNIWITNPYVVPPMKIRKLLIAAQKRGVDVRILTSYRSDIPFFKSASRYIYPQFLSEGIRIFEYTPSELHAKCLVVDDIYTSIGSYNWDILSHEFNLEINVNLFDKKLAKEMKDQFLIDTDLSVEVKLEDFQKLSRTEKLWRGFLYYSMRSFFFIMGDNVLMSGKDRKRN